MRKRNKELFGVCFGVCLWVLLTGAGCAGQTGCGGQSGGFC